MRSQRKTDLWHQSLSGQATAITARRGSGLAVGLLMAAFLIVCAVGYFFLATPVSTSIPVVVSPAPNSSSRVSVVVDVDEIDEVAQTDAELPDSGPNVFAQQKPAAVCEDPELIFTSAAEEKPANFSAAVQDVQVVAIAPKTEEHSPPSEGEQEFEEEGQQSDEQVDVHALNRQLGPGSSAVDLLANGEPVTLADFNAERLAKMKPRRNPRHTQFSQKGGVRQDDERLRFDADDDYFSIYDDLHLGDHTNIDLSFELEFDPDSTADRSDLTVFWGAENGPRGHRQGEISAAWTGYEMKLGGPGINHFAYKYNGHDLTDRGAQAEAFEPGRRYQVEIQQRDGQVQVKVDGETVYTREAEARRADRSGFGLLFYQTSGWIGPVSISATN